MVGFAASFAPSLDLSRVVFSAFGSWTFFSVTSKTS